MKKVLKKPATLIIATLALVISGTISFTGCANGSSGGGGTSPITGGGSSESGETEEDQFLYDPSFGNLPYDQPIFNTGVIAHNFTGTRDISEGIDPRDLNERNYYNQAANTYIQNLGAELEASMADRPAAKNYFNRYIQDLRTYQYPVLTENNRNNENLNYGGYANSITQSADRLLTDIIMHLPERNRYRFDTYFNALDAEVFKAGEGYTSDTYINKKNSAHESALADPNYSTITIQQDFANGYVITYREYLNTLNLAAQSIGNGVTGTDLKNLLNAVAFTGTTLRGLSVQQEGNRTAYSCNYENTILNALNAAERQQNNGRSY